MRSMFILFLAVLAMASLAGCRSAQKWPDNPRAATGELDPPVAEVDPDEPVAPPRPGAPLPPPLNPASVFASADDGAAPTGVVAEDAVSAGDLDVVAADVNETRADVDDLAVRYARTERKLGLISTQVEQLDGKVTAVEGRVEKIEQSPSPAAISSAKSAVAKQTTLQRLVRWWRAGSPMADSCLRQIRRDNVGATKAGILALLRGECIDREFLIWAGDRIPADQGQEGSANP